MVDTIKFSQMTDAGNINNNDKTPGLSGGENVLFNNAWTFLPPGTTAERPAPSSVINFRLRFNTTDQLYEYYDAVQGAWTQLQESLFTQGPFITYTASASLPDAQNLALLANGLLKQSITLGVATLDIAVAATDYWAPGNALTRTQVPAVGDDVTNKTYVDALVAGSVTSLQGTANQVLVNATSGTPQTGALILTLPQDIASTSSPTFAALTLTSPLTGANGGTGVNNGASTITLGGSLSTIGAFTAAFTMTGNTAVTFPTSGTLATTSGASGHVNSGNINELAWYAATGDTVSGLTTGNNGVLITDAGGVPSISSTLPSTVQTNITALGAQAQALNMNTHLINNVVDPVSPQDAATRAFVEALVANLAVVFAARLASTVNLAWTYSNGSSGIGATLTNSAPGTFQLDSTTVALNDLVLIKNQSSTLENGYYKCTNDGSVTAAVLTRSVDYDQPSEINPGDIFVITAGSTQTHTSWIETSAVVAIGTDPITFSQFSVALPIPVSSGGTGVTSLTAYAPIFGGTTATGPVQSGTVGTLGQVLTSNGPGVLPSFQAAGASGFTSIKTTVITGSTTFTPQAGAAFFFVRGVGGGGGAGGIVGGTAGQAAISGMGASAGYFEKLFDATQMGADAAVTIGAAGVGGASGNNAGGTGGTTTFNPAGTGATLTATGGSGGSGMAESASAQLAGPGSPGAGSNGDINISGNYGATGRTAAGGASLSCEGGGASYLSVMNYPIYILNSGGGTGGGTGGYGSGANGRYSCQTGGSTGVGQPGEQGVVIVTEFIV